MRSRILGVLFHRVTLTYLLVLGLWLVAGQLRPGFSSYGHLRYLLELSAVTGIAAVVLGGVGFLGGQGTLRGAVAGSLLLAILINVMFFLGFPQVAQYVAKGLIIVGAMALRLLKER